VDIATQEILEVAEEADKKRQRTLGVLTKPDLVDKGAENTIVDIIEGKNHPLNLGWCVVPKPGSVSVGRYVHGPRYGRKSILHGRSFMELNCKRSRRRGSIACAASKDSGRDDQARQMVILYIQNT